MSPRYGGYDTDLEPDDGQLPEGCLPMSKLRSMARAIRRQALLEETGMGQMAHRKHAAKAAAIRRAMADKKKKEATTEVLQKMSQEGYEALPKHDPKS
jgi:predicted ArsR family transcriptional regulator